MAKAHLPDWPQSENEPPPTLTVLDFLEFCFERVAEPIHTSYHSFFRHHHLAFDREKGQERFRRDVNLILARNGLAYELESNGQVNRISPPVLREMVRTVFSTRDQELDDLLNTAIAKYLSPDIRQRKESLEKLWDAWERLKTLENPTNKNASIEALFNKAVPTEELRDVANADGLSLTNVGNQFMIRHSEVGKVQIERSEDIDYLFHRLFALVLLLLRATGRC